MIYLDDFDIDDRKKLLFYYVVFNLVFKVKWWLEWGLFIYVVYYGDVKGMWNVFIRILFENVWILICLVDYF